MRDKSTNRECDPVFKPRNALRFSIGPNSHISKVQRWFDRGGGLPAVKQPERAKKPSRMKLPRDASTYRGARRNNERYERRDAKYAARRELVSKAA
jgi:hypothetical protein